MRDYCVRRLRDSKGSVDLERVDAYELSRFGSLCAWTLAHAHARTGDRHVIAGYLGKGAGFDNALCEFAQTYVDKTRSITSCSSRPSTTRDRGEDRRVRIGSVRLTRHNAASRS